MLLEEPGKLVTKKDKKLLKFKDLLPQKESEEKLSTKPPKELDGLTLKNH